MNVQDENQRPVTIGDIKKFRKDWIQNSAPILFYGGLLMVGLGVFMLFIPVSDDSKLFISILALLFGIGSIVLSFLSKKIAKKIQV